MLTLIPETTFFSSTSQAQMLLDPFTTAQHTAYTEPGGVTPELSNTVTGLGLGLLGDSRTLVASYLTPMKQGGLSLETQSPSGGLVMPFFTIWPETPVFETSMEG